MTRTSILVIFFRLSSRFRFQIHIFHSSASRSDNKIFLRKIVSKHWKTISWNCYVAIFYVRWGMSRKRIQETRSNSSKTFKRRQNFSTNFKFFHPRRHFHKTERAWQWFSLNFIQIFCVFWCRRAIHEILMSLELVGRQGKTQVFQSFRKNLWDAQSEKKAAKFSIIRWSRSVKVKRKFEGGESLRKVHSVKIPKFNLNVKKLN